MQVNGPVAILLHVKNSTHGHNAPLFEESLPYPTWQLKHEQTRALKTHLCCLGMSPIPSPLTFAAVMSTFVSSTTSLFPSFNSAFPNWVAASSTIHFWRFNYGHHIKVPFNDERTAFPVVATKTRPTSPSSISALISTVPPPPPQLSPPLHCHSLDHHSNDCWVNHLFYCILPMPLSLLQCHSPS